MNYILDRYSIKFYIWYIINQGYEPASNRQTGPNYQPSRGGHFTQGHISLVYTVVNTVLLSHIIKELYPKNRELQKVFSALYKQTEHELRILLRDRQDGYLGTVLSRDKSKRVTWDELMKGQSWLTKKKKKRK